MHKVIQLVDVRTKTKIPSFPNPFPQLFYLVMLLHLLSLILPWK